jgi:hypothetical protein
MKKQINVVCWHSTIAADLHIVDHDLLKKGFGPMIADHDLVKK